MLEKGLLSNYGLRSLGTSVDGEVIIMEEERDMHLHIIDLAYNGFGS